MDRSATPYGLRHWPDEQRRIATTGPRGRRAGHAGLHAQWPEGHPLPLDVLPGRDVVASSSRGDHKVEVSEQGINTRFVVTDLEHARTKVLYQKIYCARGQAENEIKDHKLYVQSDRTSCHRFEANQLRLLLHSAAYVLLETLRREVLKTTQWAFATMETIQLRLLKLGARVQEFGQRRKISLPSSCPVAPVVRRTLTLLACVRLTSQVL